MPVISHEAGLVCGCCALATQNNDTSGCEFHCGDDHVERLAQYGLEPNENAVIGDPTDNTIRSFRCVGCGDDVFDYPRELIILTEIPRHEEAPDA